MVPRPSRVVPPSNASRGHPGGAWARHRAASLGAALSLSAAGASAQTIVVVTDNGVSQFRETADGVRQVLRDAETVDVASGDVASQVRAKDPAVVLAIGGKAASMLKEALRGVPLVYATVLHPASKGLTGPSITGVPMEVGPQSVLPRIKQLSPQATRVGILYDPSTAAAMVEAAVRVAGDLGLTVVAKPVRDAREIRATAEALAGRIDALWMLPDAKIMTPEVTTYLVQFAIERRIAAIGFLDQMTSLGTVASLAPDFVDIGRRAGSLAKEIASRPPDKRIPVPAPTYSPGALSVNLRTAAQIGVAPPAEFAASARKVIR